MKRILAMICFATLLLVGCGSESTGGLQDDVDITYERKVNEAYTQFCNDNNIPDIYYIGDFEGEIDNSYAMKDEDGFITISQYSATDDTVYAEACVLYYPISELDEAQKAELDKNMKEAFADIVALDFVESTFSTGEQYYEIKFILKELDNPTNYRDAALAGYYEKVPVGDAVISYSKTTAELIAEGYIARYAE